MDPDSDIDVPDEIPDECNVLTGGSNSPLLQCIDELPNDAKQFLEDCSYDCAEGTSSGKSCQEVACSVIEAFVEFCEDILDTVLRDWRDDANCREYCSFCISIQSIYYSKHCKCKRNKYLIILIFSKGTFLCTCNILLNKVFSNLLLC